jgi:conjugative transfer signal peptidase TraF
MSGKAVQRCFLGAGVMLLAVLTPLGLHYSNLRWNRTESVPTGLYRIVDPSRVRTAQYAALCLPENMLVKARRIGIILPSGECPSGVAPLLKPLYQATPETPIIFTERGFEIYGRLLRNTAPKSFSSKGRQLEHIPFGVYTAGIWAVSDWNPDSFDSRYFGPIPASSIRFHLAPFLLF